MCCYVIRFPWVKSSEQMIYSFFAIEESATSKQLDK